MLLAASASIAVGAVAVAGFTGGAPVVIADHEPNDTSDSLENISAPAGDFVLVGKLEKRYAPDCEPDTFMVLFDKLNRFVASDDNGSNKGNGWASGLFGVSDAAGFIDNGDGTRSLRVGVTGRADGFDANFNGLNQNGPHGQLGAFTLYVTFRDASGAPIDETLEYTDEFAIGAEAFYINFIVPASAASADICIDNTVGKVLNCTDVDYLCLKDLVPLCEYCITQIGGIDCECRPTDALLGWFDKNMNLIALDDESGPVPGYARLCVVADIDGRARIAVTGSGDEDFDGYLDGQLLNAGGQGVVRAPAECPDYLRGHGVCGCYTLDVRVNHPHNDGTDPDEAQLLNAMTHGDINMDGVTNTADLGILLGAFGWSSSR
ncbi:MAG: hypothetical protein H6813_06965 [Phycisphaeraceae bacterium]|nr:hypothetical protein [Phycisphaeraceae bacterium]MCB9848676.1 hypothetical protein [Phycisphaeraceae bacterium]